MTNLHAEPVAPPVGNEAARSTEAEVSGPDDHASLVGRELASGRFRVLRKLGAGGMGVVYEAYDQERDQNVALKQIVRSREPAGHALKAEFRSLAELQHRNVVRLHELFCEEEPWFFTMDLVQGHDFVCHVRGGAPVATRTTVRQTDLASTHRDDVSPPVRASAARLREALIGLAEGLSAIHAAGKLHCDIKPSNVTVTPDGRAVILDFGLVTGSVADPWRPNVDLAGTPGYIAPERFAGTAPTEAGDWYAVGAMMFEAVTGHLPGPSGAAQGLAEWEDPAESDPRLLPTLREACAGLLQPDPQQRWDGHALLEALSSGARPRRSPGADLLVGRSAELEALHELVALAARGKRSVVALIRGESGIGKSALIARFAADMRSMPHTVVLQSRCYERESVAYKTFDGLVDELAAFWSHLPAAEAAALLPRDVGSLLQVFPILKSVPVLAEQAAREVEASQDPRERRASAFRALQEVLARVAERFTLVVAIDDLQWGDTESATELVQLVTGDAAPAALLIGAYRSTDTRQSIWLERLPGVLTRSATPYRELELRPLTRSDVVDLAEALSEQPLSPSAVSAIADSSHGNPFFIREFIGHDDLQDRRAGASVHDLIQLRVDHLSAAERVLLELIALSPAPVKRRVLRDASGLAGTFDAALGELLARRFVRSRRGRAFDLLEPYHDRIREHVCALLTPETQRRHHLAFASVLQRESGAPSEIIAVHMEGADGAAEASRLYALAAAEARAALAFGHAATMLQKSLELGAADGSAVDASRLVELAELAALAGEGPRSAQAYRAAADVCDTGQRASLKLRAAEQLLFSGHFEPAVTLLREVLPGFGLAVPDWPSWRLNLKLLFNTVRVLLTWLFTAKVAPGAALQARICATLGDALLYLHFGMSGYFYQQHVIRGLRAGDPTRLAQALTSRALLVTSPFPQRLPQVLPDLERARAIASSCGEPMVHGQVTLQEAVVYSATGRYADTLKLARQAEAIFRRDCQGVTSGLTHAIAWQSVSLFYLGRFDELRELCRDNLLDARRRGDEMLSKLLSIWSAWAALARDQPDEALRSGPELDLERRFTVLDAGVLSQRALLFLYLDRAAEAWETHARCEPFVRQAGVLTARARAYEFYWTRGLVASHLLHKPAFQRRARRVLRRDIRTLAAARSDEALAMAEHLEGNLCAMSGRPREAFARWKAAARLYDACNMRALAQTLSYAAALAGDTTVARETALAELTSCGVHNTQRWTATWCPQRSA